MGISLKYLKNVKQKDIDRYLVRWDLEADEVEKAYPNDEFTQEDWQLLDFMNKLELPDPLNDDGTPKGQVYKLWTNDLKIKITSTSITPDKLLTTFDNTNRPWWKFW